MLQQLTLNEQKKAEVLRRLLGGHENGVLPDGAIDGYRSICMESAAYCVVCIRFSAVWKTETGDDFLRILEQTMAMNMQGVNYEVTSDESGLITVLLETSDPAKFKTASLRQVVRTIGVTLERTHEQETRIGYGTPCTACSYVGFSKAEAMRSMNRYNVSKTIRNVLTYVSLNFTDPDLSNGQIAKDNFLNYSYLCNQFKAEMGITLNRYISEFRMKTAHDLLKLPNRDVLQVARMVGYTDAKYFSKCFKATYGLTPYQYLQQLKKKREIQVSR